MVNSPYLFGERPDIDEFIAFLGLRASRLALCAFDVYVGFATTTSQNQCLARTHIMESLGRVYDNDTIDRGLQRLEAHGMLECVLPPRGGCRHGAHYRACPSSAWHPFDPSTIERRRARFEARGQGAPPRVTDPPPASKHVR